MAILGQILGTSFGRQPLVNGSSVHMPQPFMPQMTQAPSRAQFLATHYGGGGGNTPAPDAGAGGPDLIDKLLKRGGPYARGVPGASGQLPNPTAAGGVAPAAAPNGIMQQIMGAFNSGYGNGTGAGFGTDPLDISKLIQMAPMIMGG